MEMIFYRIIDGIPEMNPCFKCQLKGIPCEEEHSKVTDDIKRPSVKRHKLGTTTISNQVTKSKEDIVKDLMLLKELDTLASTAKETTLQNGGFTNFEEASPLAESLKKLQEINDEIRRLRSLSYKETLEQYEQDMDYDEIDMSELSEVNSITEVNETSKTDHAVDSDVTSTDLEGSAREHFVEINAINISSESTTDVSEHAPPEYSVENVQNDTNSDDKMMSSVETLVDGLSEKEEEITEGKEVAEIKKTEIQNEQTQIENENNEVAVDDKPEIELEQKTENKTLPKQVSFDNEDKDILIEENHAEEKSEKTIAIENTTKFNEEKEREFAGESELEDEATAEISASDIKISLIEEPTVKVQKASEMSSIYEATVEKSECAESAAAIQETEKEEDTNENLNGDNKSSSTQELQKNQLESVTEETEEELKAVGSGKSPALRHQKHDGLVTVTQARSLTELPPQQPKIVGILKRRDAKKERPLSDSFENLRMVEMQSNMGLFRGNEKSDLSDSGGMTRGGSLDTLTKIDGVDGENTDSQVSLDQQYSQESISTESESGKSVSRSNSGKFSLTSSQRATSLISLNDITVSRCSSTSSQEEFDRFNIKRGSLLARLSKSKKAKSMTSLEVKNSKEEEEKRRTASTNLAEGILVGDKRNDKRKKSKDHKDIVTQDMYGIDILVQQVHSYDPKLKPSTSSSSVDKTTSESKIGSPYDNHKDDSSSLPVDKPEVNRKKSNESKDKRIKTDEKKHFFNILRSKPKDKISVSKDKGKEKEDQTYRKDSDSKPKVPSKKPKVPTKPDVTNFLTKRGTSFRHNIKSSSDSKSNDKKKSPTMNRKVSSAIPENGEVNDNDSSVLLIRQNLSSSRTSLDSLPDSDSADYFTEETNDPLTSGWDSDLDAKDEPETWSELVDKKVQRKMHAKDIKRQDVIYELIQTEALYVRTLHIMKKIYANGMLDTLTMNSELVDRIFPLLDDLIDLNGGFIKEMKTRQEESQNFVVEQIGDILVNFFGGENGETLKKVYGFFCSHHLEAVRLYKNLSKNDRQFAAFVKKCLINDRVRRLSIPECITYVTIRMTKYPLLIEAIIKATKENKPDYEKLKTSLNLVKEVLHAVDDAVELYEKEKELKAIRKSLDRKFGVEIKTTDPSSSASTKTVFKPTQVFNKKSRLILDKRTTLRGKHKVYDTRMIILATKIVFFQENSGKLQLLTADNKPPVFSLKNVLVKEVATDNKALFLVTTGKDTAAQIYEIGCESPKDKKELHEKLQNCIKGCPDEESGTSDEEEALREEEERQRKLKDIVEKLQLADEKVSNALTEKNRLVIEMRELIESMDDSGVIKGSPCSDIKPADISNARETLEVCLNEVNTLSSTFSASSLDAPTPSPLLSPALPGMALSNSSTKRSETFGAYERVKPSASLSNVNRSISANAQMRQSSTIDVSDSSKPLKRQSQILSAMARSKTVSGSSEDLTSLSSSTSLTSLYSSMQLFQSLRDRLTSLVDITNKQDIEVGSLRRELQETRTYAMKLKDQRKELEEKITLLQKESDKQSRIDKEQYSKLKREFRRTVDQLNKQLEDKKTHYNQLLAAYNEQNHVRNGSAGGSGKKRQEEVILI